MIWCMSYIRNQNITFSFPIDFMANMKKYRTPGDIVNPGDQTIVSHIRKVVMIGPGLSGFSNAGFISGSRLGKLHKKLKRTFWVDSKTHCYVPRNSDLVVGVIVSKRNDSYKVDINAPDLAALSFYAFEGATKKLKPVLEEGDIIFARVLLANEGMEPEIVCINSCYKAGLLGILEDGFLFEARLDFVHQILRADDLLLKTIGKKVAYEIAVGVNGTIWLNAETATDVQFVYSYLLCSENKFIRTGRTISHYI